MVYSYFPIPIPVAIPNSKHKANYSHAQFTIGAIPIWNQVSNIIFEGHTSFLVPPFWTSGNVCPEFQSQDGWIPSLECCITCVQHIPEIHFCYESELSMADPTGVAYGPKFSQFHAVFRKIWQNRMLAPPG